MINERDILNFNERIKHVNEMIDRYSQIVEFIKYYRSGADNDPSFKHISDSIDVNMLYKRSVNVIDEDPIKDIDFIIDKEDIGEYQVFYENLLNKRKDELIKLYNQLHDFSSSDLC